MTLGVVTYNTLITQVKDWIKTNCINISNYGALPSCFKPGYSVSGTCSGTFPTSLHDTYTITIGPTSVNQVDASTVDTQMTTFWNTCGNLNVNLNVSPNNYLPFIQDMTSFCAARVYFAVSQYDSGKYLIYNNGTSVSYLDYKVLNSSQKEYAFVSANEISYNGYGMLYTILNAVNQKVRLMHIQYSTNIT